MVAQTVELQGSGTTRLEEPLACSEVDHRRFTKLVLQGFPGAVDLDRRIRDSRWLAFHYTASGELVAVAALKAPDEWHRSDLFRKADAPVSGANYKLDLGWVFVDPDYRGRRIARNLCRQLLARVPDSCVFSTTRTDNEAMTRILLALGFERVGTPYLRREEELALFVLRRPALPAANGGEVDGGSHGGSGGAYSGGSRGDSGGTYSGGTGDP